MNDTTAATSLRSNVKVNDLLFESSYLAHVAPIIDKYSKMAQVLLLVF